MADRLLGEPVLDGGVPGLAIFGGGFEDLIERLQYSIGRLSPDPRTRIGVPPVISRALLERVGYVESFPHLLGTINVFTGDDQRGKEIVDQVQRGGAWTEHYDASDLAALPAACYHIYPQLAGARLDSPLVVDVTGHCYRHERTAETGRMRSFRMRELVRIDADAPTLAWRDGWIERGRDWLGSLGLTVRVERASDPFFGAAERLIGAMQRAEQLKWELVVEVGAGITQAVVSCNYHKDHFAAEFGFGMSDGHAHTACVAFGLERIALAVLHRHSPDPASWPA